MNRMLVILILSLFISCMGRHNSKAQKATITNTKLKPTALIDGDTTYIDKVNSNIHWKGTKMRGAGKHEGEIDLKNGYLISECGQLVGGKFVVDMTTILVTDIPEHETIPRNNLNNHLKSQDFFDVEKHPNAEFQITIIDQTTADSLKVAGFLTLKDVTRHIEFFANYENDTFATKFTINRYEWDIAYTGSWSDRTLVDKNIEMNITLLTE
ncbi:YceI family protein [Maribacter aestuarii]|uniref:YceI family protein n=1 Tax=Maribacter aestuarii TaxID=1130723 RepID=UPI00248AB654|nr:YceI family protein [Maribacter aestuarii]